MYINRFVSEVRQSGNLQVGWKHEGQDCWLCEALTEQWANGTLGTLPSPDGNPERLEQKMLRYPHKAGIILTVMPTMVTAVIWMVVDGEHFKWTYWGTDSEVKDWVKSVIGIEPIYQ